MKIKSLRAYEAYDSRGLPTLGCVLTLDSEISFKSLVPSGTSKSRYEALDLRDGEERLNGLGLQGAINSVENVIAPQLINRSPDAVQMDLDIINLDSTLDKSVLGANAMLAVSMAVYRAQAFLENLELFEFISFIIGNETVSLPVPAFNLINGGKHATNNVSIQEYLVIPAGAQTFAQSMESAFQFNQILEKFLIKNNKSICFGLEGGFAAEFKSSKEPLDFFNEVKNYLNFPANYFLFGINAAASHFYDPASRVYNFDEDFKTSQQLIDWYESLNDEYGLYYLEDPFNQDDAAAWKKLAEQASDRMLIVGDDIFATNLERIIRGVEAGMSNSVVIKPSQIGTITESIQVAKVCKDAELSIAIADRSGETEDSFIADLAVGVSSNIIKAGGLRHSDRLSKYNRLLEIENYLTSME